MKTANEIWQELTTSDCCELIDRYGENLMPYDFKRPNEQQIIDVLSSARKDSYLLTPFKECKL